MIKDFEIYVPDDSFSTKRIAKDPATVIPAGVFVKKVSGLAEVDDGTGTELAYTMAGAGVGEDSVLIADPEVAEIIYQGNAKVAFDPITMEGLECDLAIVSGKQVIDQGATANKVFKIVVGDRAGFAGETTPVRFRLIAPLGVGN